MRIMDTEMGTAKIPVRRSARMVLTAICAILLVAGLLMLARLHAQAQAGPETVEAELSVEKRANTDIAAPGDTLTYSVSINSSLPETTLWMTDTLPDGLRLITNSLDFSGKGSFGWTGNTVTWTSPGFGLGNFAVITFSTAISPDLEGEVVNTAQVTGTGELVTDAWSTTVVSGLLNSQIHSPNRDAYITEKGSWTIGGIAWREGVDIPYLTGDTVLSLDRVNEWSYWARWTEVASAASYILQESTDPNFTALTDNIPVEGTSKLIAKASAEEDTYYYRVQAIHASVDVTPTRWSNVVSAIVPWLGGATGTSTSALAETGAADDTVTVQVRAGEVGDVESSEWHSADVTPTSWGWTWSHEWTLPEAESTPYLIQSRASEDGETFGSIDTITVTVDNAICYAHFPLVLRGWPPLPKAPTLWVEDENQDGDLTVRWTYDHAYPPAAWNTSYTLWEAEDETFTDPLVFNVSETFKERGDREDGTCYKVRANNSYGPGAWSNVVCIVVDTGFRDDFDDPDSGWDVRRTSSPDLDNMDVRYRNGQLYTRSDDRWDFGLFSPLVEAPAMPYKITMRTKLEEGVDAPGYGIVFRAKRGDFCPVDRDDAEDNDGCFSHYFRVNVTIDPGNHIRYEVKRIEDHDERGRAEGKVLSAYKDIDDKADWNGWNTWEVEVHEDRFRISVNGEHLGTYWDDHYVGDRQFGILTSCYEYNPAEFKHEYFYVEKMN